MKIIGLASDHAGYELKEYVKKYNHNFCKFQQFCYNSEIIIHYDIPELKAISAPFSEKRIILPLPDVQTEVPFSGFMKSNAFLALQTVKALGFEVSPSVLADFKGVDRRMTVHGRNENRILLEDYAHHPVELASSLDYLKELYPEYRINVIFQPHRYARLKKYFSDFVRILDHSAAVALKAHLELCSALFGLLVLEQRVSQLGTGVVGDAFGGDGFGGALLFGIYTLCCYFGVKNNNIGFISCCCRYFIWFNPKRLKKLFFNISHLIPRLSSLAHYHLYFEPFSNLLFLQVYNGIYALLTFLRIVRGLIPLHICMLVRS